jgi:hypothetical protein
MKILITFTTFFLYEIGLLAFAVIRAIIDYKYYKRATSWRWVYMGGTGG